MAGGHIKLPSMPWTCHDAAAKHPFSQRAAGMRADTVNDVYPAVHVVYGKDLSGGRNFQRLTVRNFCQAD